jgi:hypothetical protein
MPTCPTTSNKAAEQHAGLASQIADLICCEGKLDGDQRTRDFLDSCANRGEHLELASAIIATLSAAGWAPRADVLDGWVLVPREPTG